MNMAEKYFFIISQMLVMTIILNGGLSSDTDYAKRPGFHDGVRAVVKGEWTAIEMPDGRWVTSEIKLLKEDK